MLSLYLSTELKKEGAENSQRKMTTKLTTDYPLERLQNRDQVVSESVSGTTQKGHRQLAVPPSYQYFVFIRMDI